MSLSQKQADLLRAFEAILANPAEQRSHALDTLALTDAATAAELRRLLDADARNADGFLQSPPLGRELTAQALEAPITAGAAAHATGGVDPAAFNLGRYRGLAVLGLSHHAIVLLAEQTDPVRRLVAVKILREENASGDAWARFERERQAVATLVHENIARLYDAGATEDGCPYFVMEYVPGRPLTAFAAQCALPARERLALFVQVCRAVEHAHENGLLHRDLKPGNILATAASGEPIAKIIDFGVVGAHGRAPWATLTRQGCSVGTPLYMSPEQLAGQPAGPPSDVYSLGVVLYELLAGTPPSPHISCSLDETIARTRRGAVPDDAAFAALPSGIRWAVARATSASPAARYQSVCEFREDVERFLSEGRTSVDPPTTISRVRRAVARRARRLAGIGAATLLLTAVVGAVATARHVRDVEAELARFHHELAAVLVEQPVAALSDIPGVHDVRRAQLNRLEEIAASLPASERNDPKILAATAEILTAQAGLDEEEGLLHEAAERLKRVLVIRTRLADRRPDDPEASRLLSLAIVRVGDLTKHLGDVAAGVRLYEQALEIDKRLVARYPDDERLRLTLAWSFERLAYIQARDGDLDEAELGHFAQLDAADGIEGAEAERCRSAAHVHLSGIALRKGDGQAAREHAAAGLHHAKVAVRESPTSRAAQITLCTAVNHRGGVEERLGDDRAAVEIYEQALDLDLPSLSMPDPILLRDAGGLCHRAARTARRLGDRTREERFLQAALEAAQRRRELAPNDAEALRCSGDIHLELAALARSRADYERAEALTREAILLRRDAHDLAPDRPEHALSLARVLLTAEPEALRDPMAASDLLDRLPAGRTPFADEASALRHAASLIAQLTD